MSTTNRGHSKVNLFISCLFARVPTPTPPSGNPILPLVFSGLWMVPPPVKAVKQLCGNHPLIFPLAFLPCRIRCQIWMLLAIGSLQFLFFPPYPNIMVPESDPHVSSPYCCKKYLSSITFLGVLQCCHIFLKSKSCSASPLNSLTTPYCFQE